MKIEQFTCDGKPFAKLIEQQNGVILTQKWVYEAHAAPYLGAEKGVTVINYRVVHNDRLSPSDIEALVAAWQEGLALSGFRSSREHDIDETKEVLADKYGYRVLEVTNAGVVRGWNFFSL